MKLTKHKIKGLTANQAKKKKSEKTGRQEVLKKQKPWETQIINTGTKPQVEPIWSGQAPTEKWKDAGSKTNHDTQGKRPVKK